MQEGATAVYFVRNAEPASVEAMLQYFYTAKVDFTDAGPDPAKVLDLAVQYQVDELVACGESNSCRA